jgi:hypothetical protein
VRAFIEVKVDAPIELEQVQRYLLLHALMDVLHGPKRPYLLFLTKKEFNKCWKPARERSVCTDVQSFLQRLTADDVPEKLARKLPKAQAKDTLAQYEVVKRGAVYGATTWASVGECLVRAQTGAGNVERGLIHDFVKDLSKRELVGPKA